MERLIELLKKYEEISDYKITKVDKESNQLYFVLQKLETARVVNTTEINVTIYHRHDEKIGFATFSYSETESTEEVVNKIETSLEQAKLVSNEMFNLPEEGNYKKELASNLSNYSLSKMASKVSKTIFECINEEELSINSLEIFINKSTRRIINSRNIDKTEIKYTGFYEAIPTYTKEDPDDIAKSSVELFDEFSFGDFNEECIKEDVKQKLYEVKERYFAKKNSIENVPVILRNAELEQIFTSICAEVNYQNIYNHNNVLKVGDDLQNGGTGDKIILNLRGIIPSSSESLLFDGEGIDFTDTCIINQGILENDYGTGRFAEYLGKKATGNLPCIDVSNGNLSEEELKNTPYLDCISFSGIQIDIASDYIGGEVRLAMYFDGEKEVPVTGISISGSLKSFLKDVKLLNEVVVSGAYRGPKKALSKCFKIF